jgi:hypothetical protein
LLKINDFQFHLLLNLYDKVPVLVVGDPTIKRGGMWFPLTGLTPATIFCMSQSKTWISKAFCGGFFCVQILMEKIKYHTF